MLSVEEVILLLRRVEKGVLRAWREKALEKLPHIKANKWTLKSNFLSSGRQTLRMWESIHRLREQEPAALTDTIEPIMHYGVELWLGLNIANRERLTLIEILERELQGAMLTADVDTETLLLQSAMWGRLSQQVLRVHHEREAQELATLREEALVAQHVVERFLAHSSHELRTPLTAILGFAEILQEGIYGDLNPAQQKAAGYIENSAHNLIELVNNLLDMLRMRSGKLSLHPHHFSVGAVLREIYAMLLPLSERKRVTLKFEIADSLGTIYSDENVLRHIVYHLLTSSIRATPEHGQVAFYASQNVDELNLVMEDVALHLPAEALAQLQSHLPRLENAPARGYEQWEIGLPLVRRYVELQGGTLSIENLPEQGIRFHVRIPTTVPSSKKEVAKNKDDKKRIPNTLPL